jgi:hypothetical protein
MNKKLWPIFAGLCVLTMLTLCAVQPSARAQEVKEKPPMFTYVANWQIPRANWADLDRTISPIEAIMEKALADGTIVGYGHDQNLVHQPDAETHDDWWSAMSIAGLLKMLDQIQASGESASSALTSATKHWDEIYVSRYYNWHSGPYKGGYTRVAVYKLKAEAPDDAVAMLSKNLIVPLMEQMLANGTIIEYEIDTQAIHTEAPGMFAVVYLASNPDGLDTVQAAITNGVRANPLAVQAFESMTDDNGHRDELLKGDGTYK